MVAREEVRKYLLEFHQKMKVWGVLIRDDRGKNAQALLDLELRPVDRMRILEALQVQDYSDGPRADMLYHRADMWVFGKLVKKSEVYIKMTMGRFNDSVICISFHKAEYPLNYPFKMSEK